MSTIKAANLQNTGSGAPTIKNSSGTEIGQFSKAWVNFDGTGTVSIDDSFNVSSITDNSTGNYTINFTNAMANAEYAVAGTVETTNATSVVVTTFGTSGNSRTTSGVRIAASYDNIIVDAVECSVIVFGA
ncbi:putative alpha amylase C terminal all beta domain protein [uncultured phage MedDCM-OCT-S09-C299]|nr:putative alpha amylase C terminal all beta domain protein [uncultured phage MedDCM-OCT-S09-C299]